MVKVTAMEKAATQVQTLPDINADRIFIAIGCCIAAHLMFCIMGACAKYLSNAHHVAEIAFYRNIIILIPLFCVIYFSGKTHLFKTKKPKLVAFRAVMGGFSLIVTFGALSLLPMSYATVIFFTSTILTPVLAFLFLKEHVGIHRWLAVLFGMTGVLIIAQPSGDISTLGLAFALCAACLHASMFIVLRSLKTERVATITFYFILAGTLIPGCFLPWVAKAIDPSQIWIFLLMGVCGGLGQVFLSNAYKYGPAALVTPFAYSAIIWNTGLDIFFWKYDLDITAVITGAGFIMTAQLYILYREYMNKKHEKART